MTILSEKVHDRLEVLSLKLRSDLAWLNYSPVKVQIVLGIHFLIDSDILYVPFDIETNLGQTDGQIQKLIPDCVDIVFRQIFHILYQAIRDVFVKDVNAVLFFENGFYLHHIRIRI